MEPKLLVSIVLLVAVYLLTSWLLQRLDADIEATDDHICENWLDCHERCMICEKKVKQQ